MELNLVVNCSMHLSPIDCPVISIQATSPALHTNKLANKILSVFAAEMQNYTEIWCEQIRAKMDV